MKSINSSTDNSAFPKETDEPPVPQGARGGLFALRIVAGVVVGVVLVFCLLYQLFEFDPLDLLPSQSVCVFKLITGKPCPGCGMTHAFIHISQFKFRTALLENPFAIPFFLIISAYAVFGDLFRVFKTKLFVYLSLAVVLIWWAIRLYLGV